MYKYKKRRHDLEEVEMGIMGKIMIVVGFLLEIVCIIIIIYGINYEIKYGAEWGFIAITVGALIGCVGSFIVAKYLPLRKRKSGR